MININYDLINDLKTIKSTDIEEVIIVIYFNGFINRLSKPEFLKDIWRETQDIEFIKEMITEFCRKKEHQSIVNSAWVIVPEGLGQPIKRPL
jgi:hypothetical protein